MADSGNETLVDESTEPVSGGPLHFLSPVEVEAHPGCAFVLRVDTLADCEQCIRNPPPGIQWIEVRHQIANQEFWAFAAQGDDGIPMDVQIENPAAEFGNIYRLVDVAKVRDVRVVIPVMPGFLKALRLAASIGLPVQLSVGQPTGDVLDELNLALDFYLHDPMVEAPVEFFHTLLETSHEPDPPTLWHILEGDPSVFRKSPIGNAQPETFVQDHLARLIEAGAECAGCTWVTSCAGYFKSPDPAYDCHGVKTIFARIRAAADELASDLEQWEASSR